MGDDLEEKDMEKFVIFRIFFETSVNLKKINCVLLDLNKMNILLLTENI